MTGAWRVLVLDRDPADPKWIIGTVVEFADVRPADLDAEGKVKDWDEVMRWAADRAGGPVALASVDRPLAWRIDGQAP
jgi:hypothetical protein